VGRTLSFPSGLTSTDENRVPCNLILVPVCSDGVPRPRKNSIPLWQGLLEVIDISPRSWHSSLSKTKLTTRRSDSINAAAAVAYYCSRECQKDESTKGHRLPSHYISPFRKCVNNHLLYSLARPSVEDIYESPVSQSLCLSSLVKRELGTFSLE
jgi:hypothetical protein